MISVRLQRLRLIGIVVIAACLLFGAWALWQFPAYARQLPPRILPNSSWTTAEALTALADLGWSVETYVRWRLGFVGVTAVFYIVLGLFIFVRGRRDAFALLFGPALVLFGIGTADLPFILAQWGFWGDRLAYGLAAVSFGYLMLLVFVFPNGRFNPRSMRWVGFLGLLFIFYAGFLQPQPTRPPAPIISVFSTIIFLAAVGNQAYRFSVVATAEQRQQTKWVLWAIGLNLLYKLILTFIYASPTVNAINAQGMWYSLLRTTSLTLVTATAPVAITFAIFRYRLWDIDLIIRKTFVYGLMSAGVIGVYVLLVGYLSLLFQAENRALWFSLLATGVVALLFMPLKNWLEQQVNRLFYGQRDEPYQLLTRLGKQLETTLDPAQALAATVATVAQALKLPYVAIGLQQGEGMQLTAVSGASVEPLNQYPLTFAGQPIGTLLVADRSPNDPLTPADHQLLADLSHQIGVAAHAMLLTTSLEQARLRLVTERGEARRRLGSDLHDVVGHQLVGLNRQLQHAMHELGQNPEQARQHLAEIDSQLTALTHQVRHLAHQLYPPELALLGLVGALREQVQTHPTLQIVLDAPERLPKLSAEVETAVYAITLEAITNIEKHAHAQTCAIRLGLDATSQPPVLELDIVDDGAGVAAGANAGLGLLSMQARAAEVGGVCKIMQNGVGSGTAVAVRIPCPILTE